MEKKPPFESLRIFYPQTRDPGMLLWPEVQAGYASAFLTGKLGMNPQDVRVESMYPFPKYHAELLRELPNFREKTFLFFLENYYHSSIFCDRYVASVFESAPEVFKNREVIVQSSKMGEEASLEYLRRFPFVKVLVRTDVEYYFLEKYVRGKKDSEIANVTYRDDNGNPAVSASEDVTFDLSECVFPGYEDGVILREKDNYHRIVGFLHDDTGAEDDKFYYRKTRATFLRQLENAFLKKKAIITTGRGCRYKCTYCYRGAKYSKVRQLPLETIKKDLDVLKNCGFKTVYVYDDCFATTNFDRMAEIVELFASYDFEYQIAVRYETCTGDNLELLKNLKLSFVQIGLQSASKATNAKIGRNFHHERMKKVVSFLKENGAYVSLDVILGLP